MKLANVAILAVCLAATPAFASKKKTLNDTSPGVITEQEMSACISIGELSEKFLVVRNEGVSKHVLYSLVLEEKLDPSLTSLAHTLIDAVYAGATPDRLFDICMETSKEH